LLSTAIPHLVIKIPAHGKRQCLVGDDLIEAHNVIARTHGKAFFGRIGRPLAESKILILNQAIGSSLPTSLILACSTQGSACFRAPLLGVFGPSHTPNLSLCPTYYHDLLSSISLWLEIGAFERVSHQQLSTVVLASTGRSIVELLSSSQTSMMLAEERRLDRSKSATQS
jgi:hypothetical protein